MRYNQVNSEMKRNKRLKEKVSKIKKRPPSDIDFSGAKNAGKWMWIVKGIIL